MINIVIIQEPDGAVVMQQPAAASVVVIEAARGRGVPSGGLEGEHLVKNSDTSYDTSWMPPDAGSTPLTTKGDLLTFSTVLARLPVGTNGQALLADSTQTTGLKWGSVDVTGPIAAEAVLRAAADSALSSTISGLSSVYQPLDADLTAIAALTSAANKIPYATGAATWALADFTAAGRSVVGAADAAAQRTALGLGTLATQSGTFSGTSSGANTGDQTTITGNAGTATALATPRAINGVDFDGTAPITVTAAASTLSGTTLASGVTASSLTSAAGGSFGTAAYTAASAYLPAAAIDLSATGAGGATGLLAGGRFPALAGDVTTVAGALATTLATVNSNVGTFGSTTKASVITVNAKGLVTAASESTITLAVGSITGLGTGIATALAINVGSAGAPVLFNGAGGTPSSLTATNLSGTAASLTAGNVTTNANLTGPITSSGNATSVAAQTGTGSTFVMATAPTIAGGTHTAITALGIRSTGAAFDLVLANAETLSADRTLTVTLGNAARTLTLTGSPTISGATITGSGTLALGAKTLTASNTLTLAGTDSTTMTFPATSDTIAGLAQAQTFSAAQAISLAVSTTSPGLTLATTATATVGAQKFSPSVIQTGSGFGTIGSAAQAVSWKAEVVPVQGAAAPTSIYTWSSSVNGGAYTSRATLDSSGFLTISSITTTSASVPACFNGVYAGGNSNDSIRLSANGAVTIEQRGSYGWSSAINDATTNSRDTFLSRGAAATIQQGAANAASPVAQTLQAQGCRGGTDTNVGGASYTWQPGVGTGTGTASSAIIQAPTVAASGTGAQTMSEIVRFNTTSGVRIKTGVALQLGNAAATGLVAGALAALTNATLVFTDDAGVVYRVPCIV